MRLVIDCFKLIKGTGKSIGIYNVAQGIVKHLGQMNSASENQKAEILVLGNKYNQVDFDVPGVKFIEIKKYDPRNIIHVVLWELFFVSQISKKLKADRVFFPRGYTALTHPVYDIVLIHDLIPFYYDEHFPGYLNKLENAYIMGRLKQSARAAKKIITISQASKEDIIKYCTVDVNKITVINNACEPIGIKKQNSEKPYICAMTSRLPHKNAKGIIESYKRYCNSIDDPYDLIIIGLANVDEYELTDEIRKRITCHKFIKSNDEMYRIIGGSKLFLFLSLVEGFGLPPIEAMQLGIPVICSNTSSLPEVVGEAGVLVNPCNYDEVARTIKKLTVGNETQRNELINRGYKNVKRFSSDVINNKYWKVLVEDL